MDRTTKEAIRKQFIRYFLRGCERLHYTFPEEVVVYSNGAVSRLADDKKGDFQKPLGVNVLDRYNKEAMSLKDIGDAALVLSGMLTKDVNKRGYYSGIGMTAYGSLGNSRVLNNELYLSMEECFLPLLDIFEYIKHDGQIESGFLPGLLKGWEETKNPAVKAVLSEKLGLRNVIPFGKH